MKFLHTTLFASIVASASADSPLRGGWNQIASDPDGSNRRGLQMGGGGMGMAVKVPVAKKDKPVGKKKKPVAKPVGNKPVATPPAVQTDLQLICDWMDLSPTTCPTVLNARVADGWRGNGNGC